ncbi:hypothetical protein PJ267_16700 [Arthrobacter sp. OVS8]|nr:hypothetical protein PJ267_16700 [Arthrobacter sp. OVS8]
MKLLVINPNISDDVTALIEAEALRSASPEPTLWSGQPGTAWNTSKPALSP